MLWRKYAASLFRHLSEGKDLHFKIILGFNQQEISTFVEMTIKGIEHIIFILS
jgi:hypothetical protein